MGGGGGGGGGEYPFDTDDNFIAWVRELSSQYGSMVNPYAGKTLSHNPDRFFGDLAGTDIPSALIRQLLSTAIFSGFISLADVTFNARYNDIDGRWETSLDPQYLQDAAEAMSSILQSGADVALGVLDGEALEGGAVLSSAYVIAKTLLLEGNMDKLDNYTSKLALQNAQNQQQYNFDKATKASATILAENDLRLKQDGQKMDANRMELGRVKDSLHYSVEHSRYAWSAWFDADKYALEVAAKAAFFQVDKYDSGGALLASYKGGVAPMQTRGSTVSNALGGAMAGAATGAMVGGPAAAYTAAAGAVIGGIAGALA